MLQTVKTFRIHWLYFWVALLIGLIYIYLTVPLPKIIYKFPTPTNAGKITYTDNVTGKCYKVDASRVECKGDHILPQPKFFG